MISVALLVAMSSAQPKLADLAFMAGHWSDGTTEEVWLAPKGGLMLGMNRTVANGKTFFENLRIEESGGKIIYLASPGGKPATPFPLQSVQGKRAVFENAAHDFPQRIIYELDARGRLVATVEGNVNGKPRRESWTWSRVEK